ncbi:uncharacterized protein [Euwallacea similis]|uniref:uncharacterized protein n=1 Tax=Euwallacea similis TaxID=1736056 RepID=UPI00344D1D0E
MKIRYIIEKHVEIKRYSVRATEHSQLFIYTLYMVNGVFLGVISIYSIISPEVNTRDGIAMFFAYFMYSYGNCDCVQSYMDLSMTLVDSIYNLKWYQWNTQCNKMYIILLTNASRGLKISIFLIINISNDLFKEICRITYGFANFFLSFTARK